MKGRGDQVAGGHSLLPILPDPQVARLGCQSRKRNEEYNRQQQGDFILYA